MVIGYARTSTEKQALDLQLDALERHGVEVVFAEKMTGTKADRPELEKLKLKARTGDTVVVYALSRLGRSTKDLLELVDYFDAHGIILISLKEAIDTGTPVGRLLLTVLGAIAQFERELIVQRTCDGLEAARARGRKGGRPRADSKAVGKALKLYDAKTHSVKEIVALTGVSSATLYRALKK